MINLHEIFEKAQQEAKKFEDLYKEAFEETKFYLVRDAPGARNKINFSQDGVEVLHEWHSVDHQYVPHIISYISDTNLSKLTPEEILKHLSHVKRMELKVYYRDLELPLPKALGKYPLLREAIDARQQEELSLDRLIDIMKPIADTRKRLSRKKIKKIREQIDTIPLITKWSKNEGGGNPQAVARDLIDVRDKIESLKTERRKVVRAVKTLLTDPKFTEQVESLKQRWEELDGKLKECVPPNLRRISSYKEIFYGEDDKCVESKLKKPYGEMKVIFAVSPGRKTISLNSQELTTGPNADISGVTLFGEPRKVGLNAWYGERKSYVNSCLSLSCPIEVYVPGEGWKYVNETSVKANIERADDKQLELILTDMEELINNIEIMD